ncbi:acetyl-CoA synthetase-like protein [Hypoxylon cercidicola]|nr:acetyl-CoA synthetase-like protein [Hypoxylon cercidicola]
MPSATLTLCRSRTVHSKMTHPGCADIVLSELSAVLDIPLSRLDLKSSFIRNGGDSLSSIKLKAALRRHGIHVSINSIFTSSTLLCLAECDVSLPLQPCADVLLSTPLRGTKRASDTNERPPKRQRGSKSLLRSSVMEIPTYTRYQMTEMQLSLVQSTQTTPGCNVISYVETHRPENVPALKRAWQQALKIEPIFNMSFNVDGPEGFMYESQGQPFVWEETVVEDKSSYQERRREAEKQSLLSSSLATGFRIITLQLPGVEGESTIIWQVHHAMIDGISCDLVRSNVQRLLRGEQIQAGSSFTNFTSLLQTLQQQEHESATNFWAQQKQDHPNPSTELLLPIPPSDTARATELGEVYIDSNIKELTAYSKRIGVTVASLYHAAWGLALSKYADSSHICFGTVLSGRTLPFDGIQSVVGPTINTLPLNVSLDTCSTVIEYIRLVFASLLDLTSFQWTKPSHGFSRNFSSAVNVQFETPPFAVDRFEPLEQPYSRVVSDIPLHVEVGKSGRIHLAYNTKAFFKAHIEHLGATLSTALNILLDPNSTVSSCLDSLIESGQLKDLASIGNWTAETTRHGSIRDDLVSMFTRVAETDLEAIAIEHGSRVLTYDELHKQSSLVAQQLSQFVRSGDVVCVHADRTINWIVAIYAVLKIGAVYCPFDQDVPGAIRSANFTTANAKLFLTGSIAAKSTKPVSCRLCLSVEELLRDTSVSVDFKSREPCPESVAYMCLTSGSTGKPKGVMCRHRGLVAFQKDFRVRLCARPGWRIAQFMSPGFDGSIHEIFSALSYGSTLVLKDISSPFDHLKRCDAAILTPSVAKALEVDEFPNLKTVYLVGEAVPQSVCDTWGAQKQLFNMYGPTEATCGATIKALTAKAPVTLGTPNPSTRIYILDSKQRLVPWGVIGEIYLAGVQVAAGYVGQRDETAQNFIPDSVNPQYEGDFMYKTGDRAYWDERGELVFLGRNDRQIKLRGFRLDLDDLEIRMTKADERCTATALTVKHDQLVALVQPADLDVDKFKTRIRQHVPLYALPRYILAVDSFPMTLVGKLDYRAMSSMANPDVVQNKPLTVSEQRVITAVKDVLGMPEGSEINRESNFSDIGGNSLLALVLSHRLSRIFQQRIPVSMILDSPTVQDLAEELASQPVSDEHHASSVLGDYQPSPIESEWWHKYQQGDTSSFNVSYACELPIHFDMRKLIASWNLVLGRHRILSSRYRWSDRGLVREYAQYPPSVKQDEAIDIQLELNIPFDLTADDLIRVTISSTRMLVVISHIICDLTTLKTLLGEVTNVYHGRELAPLAKTYFQTSWSTSPMPCHLSFWSEYLDGASTPHPHLSIGNIGRRRTSWSGSTTVWQIPKKTYEAMIHYTSANKVTMHQLAIAAVALTLQHDTKTCDITIGAPYLNRNSEEDLEVIGLFLEPLPIRICYPPPDQGRLGSESLESPRPQPDTSRDSFVKAVQRSSRAALSHAVPWSQLLSHLDIKPDFPNHPVFDVMVTFHEDDYETYFPLEGVHFLPTWSDGAKFKLMVEFTARNNGNLALRLEYSDECFTPEDAQLIGRLVMEALEGLILGHDYDSIACKLESLRDGDFLPSRHDSEQGS